MTIEKFQKTILDWWRDPRTRASSVRGMLPWRNTRDPYKILVSEIMLQQTQVTRVIPKYEEFLKAFPTLEKLAKAPNKKLLKVWAGLGYWRRAKYLKEATKTILAARATNSQTSPRRRFGTVPAQRDKSPRAQTPKSRRDFEGRSFGISLPERLETLPGVGPYTARALACFAFGNTEAFLDTNIRRVYLHFFFPKSKNVSDKKILKIAQRVIDSIRLRQGFGETREWHYALFDYGATVLKDKTINKRSKHYHKQSKFEDSFRSFRTKAVRFILENPKNKVSRETLRAFLKKELKNSSYTPREIIASLLKDNLIKKSKAHFLL